MVNALVKEAGLRRNYLTERVETIYLGGGTPSLVPIANLQYLLQQLHELFDVDAEAEITLEANPDDINLPQLQQWKNAGVNRLSIGVQSFFEADLQWMNRAHNATQAMEAVVMALSVFPNITIDLIYGTPTLSDENWQANVQQAISLGIPHLSCYALTVEPRTALEKMIHQNKKEPVDPDKQAHHFELLMQWLGAAGYEHYEISNFARPGFRSRHNSSYWKGRHYLGLGPSAHSFNGTERQWNISNNALFLKAIAQNTLQAEKEILTPTQQLNEYLMISLRTAEGISLTEISERWNKQTAETILAQAQSFIADGSLHIQDDQLRLTNRGKLLADGIAAHLFQ